MRSSASKVVNTAVTSLLIFLVFACASSLKQQLLDEHPEWQDKYVEMIKNNNITEGMTKDMVMAAWGKPEQNSQVTEPSFSQRWVYETASPYSYKAVYVYFKDGKVVKID